MRTIAGALAVLSLLAMPALADAAKRPNVLVVMTDDQRLDDLQVMPKTRRLLGVQGGGTTFRHAYVSYPLCCPSRATFLTGQYSHNHGITWNFWPFGGYRAWQKRGERDALPVWLQRAGYTTGLIGKYLNEYGEQDPTHVPPGWDDWQASVDPSTYQYYGFTLNVNGRLVTFPKTPANYMTDVYARRAQTFVREHRGRKPWFLWLTPNAPHTATTTGRAEGTPAEPAPRHANAFADAALPRSPSFDEEDISDKPAVLGRFPRVDVQRMTEHYRGRLGSLLAVDDMVERLVTTLRRTGQLDTTLIIFTSDNGWLLGEHRVAGQKYFGFEEATRVPLLIRGPEFRAGKALDSLALNVDLAPTILRAAAALKGRTVDGMPLQRQAAGTPAFLDRDMIIETGPNSVNLPYYTGLHTRRYRLEEITTGETELYDLQRDPYELTSVHADPRYAGVLAELHARLERLKHCKGQNCISVGTPDPEPSS
jgi:N-acetylglucosamine-6-sulfatase